MKRKKKHSDVLFNAFYYAFYYVSPLWYDYTSNVLIFIIDTDLHLLLYPKHTAEAYPRLCM